MQLYSLTFVYLFLPAAMALYYATPARLKNAVLLVISLAFFALAEPGQLWLLCGTIALHFLISEGMRAAESHPKLRRLLMWLGVAENVGVILWFSIRSQLYETHIPLGTMVVSVTALGYIVDVYRHDADYERSFINYALFSSFFAKLYTGPLVRIDQLRGQLRERKISLAGVGEGLSLFVRGLAKNVLLAEPISAMYEAMKSAGERELSVLGAWMIMITLAMTLFFYLSGFCDMARGLGLVFGLALPKNFYFPFQSPCVTDFFDRFNMTVTQFFRHYVYENLQSKKSTPLQLILNTALVCMLAGLWFGIRINYIFWGLYIAAFIVIEELWLGKALKNAPKFFTRIYTFGVTMLSMVIFSGDSTANIFLYFKAMVGAGVSLYTNEVVYIITSNYFVLIAGALLLTSVFSLAAEYIKKSRPALMQAASLATSIALLGLTTAFLVL